ncbi:hypothetical protein [Brachyspira hyodysenteriae]|uniref:hypothetical protein n=1 Tax=Brachyspira hyodysenteriae TaxID=159 RepID=UPI0022CDE2BE|nr:hypothetical protein [Brachyspira hyodysenteriae]MDA0024178.1 hypothetical protein [Brachyspira hyodysenteriae]
MSKINEYKNILEVINPLLFFPSNNDKYNKYFENNSCNLGDNNEYLLPLDNTILTIKPFIKLEKEYINPFFHRLGLTLGTKLLDKYLLENNFHNYMPIKSKYCEDRTFDFIKNIFTETNCLKNVFYKKIIKCLN